MWYCQNGYDCCVLEKKKRDKKEVDTGKRRQRKEVFLCPGLGVSLVFKTGKELVGGRAWLLWLLLRKVRRRNDRCIY